MPKITIQILVDNKIIKQATIPDTSVYENSQDIDAALQNLYRQEIFKSLHFDFRYGEDAVFSQIRDSTLEKK